MKATKLLSKYNALDEELMKALRGKGHRKAKEIAKESVMLELAIMRKYGNLPSLRLAAQKE